MTDTSRDNVVEESNCCKMRLCHMETVSCTG